MTLRNMWSLNPGEVLAAQKLLAEVEPCEVYFPLQDTGVDLLVVRGDTHVGIQVKESRLYGGEQSRRKGKSHSWHQVSKKNLQAGSGKRLADFFVFLTYLPLEGENKISSFEHRYIVIPFKHLAEKCKTKKDSGGTYSFYFHFDSRKVSELRDTPEEYSLYLDKWGKIRSALSGRSA